MVKIRFSKMHGLGNDFVVLDNITQKVKLSGAQIKALADRHRGIGFDQLLLIEAPQTAEADFRYRIFNADGAEVEHCGNGARCFVHFIHIHQLSAKNPIIVETKNGLISLQVDCDANVRVNMGTPSFEPQTLPFDPQLADAVNADNQYSISVNDKDIVFGVVSVGNPHAVIRVDDIDQATVTSDGPILESHPSFANRVNVGFMQVIKPNLISLRVFERGAGETQACGTGACAAVAYGRQQGWLAEKVTVNLTGGQLVIEFDMLNRDLYMTGPATHVFNGTITIADEDTTP